MKTHIRQFIAGLLLTLLVTSCACPRMKSSKDSVNLLKPELLYTFLTGMGVDSDPDKVFQWKNGNLHISGQHYGYIATKGDYSNYVLVAEYKYGDKTWAPRLNNARDSGILCHFVGRDHVWPKSIEAQIIEGGSGDILVVSGAKLTIDGVTKGPRIERFDRPGRSPWKDVKGFVGPNEVEKPHGQWNTMKILCDRDIFGVWVNDHKTLIGSNAVPQAGKILVQSEGAEMIFRRLELQPIKN
ncbi:MAG: DUF1080 domain-containing protein [Verrucomicrobia bacterium]|nr:DUF1080 domain-containing protein [Verrucomicrobiota bacterium]